MKKTKPNAQVHSIRDWFWRVFESIIKCNCRKDISVIRARLVKLEDLVDTVAREVARQAKLWEATKKSK